jgi:hypothetical protein
MLKKKGFFVTHLLIFIFEEGLKTLLVKGEDTTHSPPHFEKIEKKNP